MSDNPGAAPATTTDQELLQRAQAGDFAAFEALAARYQPRVFGMARRIVGQLHDAEDVTQQTFLSMIEHLDQFRGEGGVAAWILRIAANHALKVLRKRRGLPTVPLETGIGDPESLGDVPHPEFIARWRDDPVNLAANAEVARLLDEAIAELEEKYRVVFVLRDVEGLSIKETADALGISVANVKVRLLRARLQLRERCTRALGDEATRLVPDHAHG